jgi:hypothetical protein
VVNDVSDLPSIHDVIIYRIVGSDAILRCIGMRGDTQVFESTDELLAVHIGCAIATHDHVRCFLDEGDGLRLVRCSSLT